MVQLGIPVVVLPSLWGRHAHNQDVNTQTLNTLELLESISSITVSHN